MKVRPLREKVTESRLRWFGHVHRRDADYVGKKAMETKVQGVRRRGRPNKRWIDSVREDLKGMGFSVEEGIRTAQDREGWRNLVKRPDPK